MLIHASCSHLFAQLNVNIVANQRDSKSDVPPLVCYRLLDPRGYRYQSPEDIDLLRQAVVPGYPYASYRSVLPRQPRLNLAFILRLPWYRLGMLGYNSSNPEGPIKLLEPYALSRNQPYACHRLVQLYRALCNTSNAFEWLEYGAARGEPECVLLKAR